MGWLKKLVDKGNNLSRVGQFPAYQHFMFFGNKNDEESGLPEVWYKNGVENIQWLDKQEVTTVNDLPKLEGKAIIFCGMSPSMHKYYKYLKGIDRDIFKIVATNSSTKFLLDRGIKPDYVIAIDGKPGSWTLDLGEKAKDITGIFSVCVEPNALHQWPGKIMIVPYGVKDKSLKKKIERRYGKGLPSGGNALNSAVAIFYQCTDAKIFLFMGNELSYKNRYYADRPSDNDESAYVYTTNIFGKRVKTLIPLFEYKIWLENMAAQLWPEYHFCNCSEGILGVEVGGGLLPCISQKRIDFAIEDVKEALKVKEGEQYKVIYDHFYHEGFGNNHRGEGVWKYIDTYFDFEKGLDVGCGYANGVKLMRSSGKAVFGSDIADARDKWAKIGVEDYCKTEYAHNMSWGTDEFDMIVCSEVMEHVPEEMTDLTLKEIARVGSDKFFFTIALKPEKIKIAGYIQSHINLHPPQWWLERISNAGIEPIFFGTNEEKDNLTVFGVRDAEAYKEGRKPLSKEGDSFPMVVMGGRPVGEIRGQEYEL
jgi:2-polyprenyl-3-methyl-5-hydroxy-6-metoxy-1,4-benzoquinol methylase